jgi:hypothetical protein
VYKTQHGTYGIPWLFMYEQGSNGMIIALSDEGKESLVNDPVIVEALKRGYSVSALDMRGIGELKGNPGWLFAVNLLLADNPIWKSAWDALTLIDEWAVFQPSHHVGLYASGPIASLAASYVMLMHDGEAPDWAVLRHGLGTRRELLNLRASPEGGSAENLPYWAFPFASLYGEDIVPSLYDSRGTSRTWIIDPLSPVQANQVQSGPVQEVTTDQFIKADW